MTHRALKWWTIVALLGIATACSFAWDATEIGLFSVVMYLSTSAIAAILCWPLIRWTLGFLSLLVRAAASSTREIAQIGNDEYDRIRTRDQP